MSKPRTPKMPPPEPSMQALRAARVHRDVIEGLSTELLVALRTEIAIELDRRRGKAKDER